MPVGRKNGRKNLILKRLRVLELDGKHWFFKKKIYNQEILMNQVILKQFYL